RVYRPLWAAPPFRLGAISIAESSRREAADRSTSWVSVSFIGISVRLATASRAVTTEAPQWRESRRGRIPERGNTASSRTATLTLCWRRESSPFCEQNARKSHAGTVAFVSSFWLLHRLLD